MRVQHKGVLVYPLYTLKENKTSYVFESWLLKRKGKTNYIVMHRDMFSKMDGVTYHHCLDSFKTFMEKSKYLYKVQKKHLKEGMLELAPKQLQGYTEKKWYKEFYKKHNQ